jgi:hypothetical protein
MCMTRVACKTSLSDLKSQGTNKYDKFDYNGTIS